MFAASPPVKFGISAFLVSAMLTMIEPENTGPMTTYAPWSTAFCARAFAVCGAVCVSSVVYSTLRPRMPPAALISLTASLTPLSKLVPAVAPVPESSMRPMILTGPCCARTADVAASASAATVLRNACFMTSSLGLNIDQAPPPSRRPYVTSQRRVPFDTSAAALGRWRARPSMLRQAGRRLRAQPGCGLAPAGRDRGRRQMRVVVVHHVEGIVAPITGALDPLDEIEDRRAVVSFRRKHAVVARGLDEIVEIPEVVGQLDQEDLVAGYRVEGVARRAARQEMERIDGEPHVGVVGELHCLPGRRVFADPAAPGERAVGDADARQGSERAEHREVLRDLARIAARVGRSRRGHDQQRRADRAHHLEQRPRDVDLVVEHVSREPLEVVEHLERAHPEAALGDELDRDLESVGMSDQVAAGQDDRAEAGGLDRAELLFERAGERVAVHGKALQLQRCVAQVHASAATARSSSAVTLPKPKKSR